MVRTARGSTDQARPALESAMGGEKPPQASVNRTSHQVNRRPMLLFLAARLILGGVFIFASLDKIVHPMDFTRTISNYQIVPDRFISLVAVILPWLELLLGALLVVGVWLPGTIVLSNLLLGAFLVALLFNLARGLNVDCGCFSTRLSGSPATSWYVIRDACFSLLGGYLFYQRLTKRSPCHDHKSGTGN